MTPEGQDEGLDDLRRRLYAPGATSADVDRYRAALPAPVFTPPSASVPPRSAAAPIVARADEPAAAPRVADAPDAPMPPEPRPHPHRRRVPLLVVAGAAAVGVVLVVALLQRTAAPSPTPAPTVTAAAAPVRQDRLPFPSAASAALVVALDRGDQAGIRRYLYEHPEARPTAISTVTRADSAEFSGEGSGTVPLRPSSLATRSGRFTLLITVDEPGRYEWRGTRLAAANDRSGPLVTVAEGSGDLAPGQVGTATVEYEDGAPTALQVLVGEHVRWGAVAVFTD